MESDTACISSGTLSLEGGSIPAVRGDHFFARGSTYF